MDIPLIKTLLKYRKFDEGEFITKNVTLKYIDDLDEQKAIEFIIEMENPFEEKGGNFRYQCKKRDDNSYCLTVYDDKYQMVRIIEVFIKSTLEFRGKLFELKEEI
ncbi:hypothetical protein [Bacillus infantis]|uniref:hypothetical protein n=1 Tax=Bacillus infantis TaxID=324767 RepID=UPI003CF69416